MDFASQQDDEHFTGIPDHKLLIMSHSSTTYINYSDVLRITYWGLVMIDEIHSIKNLQTFKHKLVKSLPKRNLLLPTTTPIQNNFEELQS